jgi:hypothetical protein
MTVRHPARLECREVVELVTEFLGDALTPTERARVEQHLLVCPPCTLHIAQVRSTIGHLAELRAGGAPIQVGPALVDLFREWKKRDGNDGT